MKTLIVCTANVCRSPVAEMLWRAAALERALPGTVTSVGLRARPGQPPSPVMCRLLEERGLPLPTIGAMPFVRAVACHHDLVLVMEPAQQRQVLSMAPELTGRVHLMGRWGQGTIEDPIGGPVLGYERCMDQLVEAVAAWQNHLPGPRARMGAASDGRQEVAHA